MSASRVPDPAGATSRTLFVAAAIGLMTAALILTKTGRDALYFQGRGLYDLPLAYMGIALLSLPVALAVLGAMRAFGPRRARVVVPLVVAALFAAFHGVARPGGGTAMTLFFMSVPLVFGVLFSLSWLLAAEFLDGVPRAVVARAYSVIGAASIAGGIAGGAVARALAMRVEPQRFILLGAAALAASAATMAVAQRAFPLRRLAARGGARLGSADLRAIAGHRHTLLLLATAMTASVVGLLIEFQFYATATASGAGGRGNASFFAGAYLLLNTLALALQLVLMPWLQRAIGVDGSLFVLPAVLLGGIVSTLGSLTTASRSILRITEGGLRSSIHRSSWEQAYLPLSRPQRAIAKVVVDGAGARIAEGIAAGALYLWLRHVVGDRGLQGQNMAWVTYLLAAALVAWLALTRVLGRSVASSLASPSADSERRIDIPLPDT
jgi:hypothetical protein